MTVFTVSPIKPGIGARIDNIGLRQPLVAALSPTPADLGRTGVSPANYRFTKPTGQVLEIGYAIT